MKIDKPVIIYDAQCNICRNKVGEWRRKTGNDVIYIPYQEWISGSYPQLSDEQCQKAVHLIMPDDQVFYGAHAIFKLMAVSGKNSRWLWSYEHVPFFSKICEACYHFLSHNRQKFSRVMEKL